MLCRGDHRWARHGRDDPRHAGAAGCPLAAGETDGLPALIRRMREKKATRPIDPAWRRSHPDWALGFADEVWWSRVAQPHLRRVGQTMVAPLRLVEQTVPRGDPDPKALACYGLLVRDVARCRGGATSGCGCASWTVAPSAQSRRSSSAGAANDWQHKGKRRCCLIWDNASWHISKAVRGWIHGAQPGGQAGRETAVRIVVCSVAHQESVAQPDRAEMDAWQAVDCRTSAPTDGGRDRRTGLLVFRLPARTASSFRRGLLIEH